MGQTIVRRRVRTLSTSNVRATAKILVITIIATKCCSPPRRGRCMHDAAPVCEGIGGKAPVDTRGYAQPSTARRRDSGFAVWGTAAPSEDAGTHVEHRARFL
jgi:hypothetical protein